MNRHNFDKNGLRDSLIPRAATGEKKEARDADILVLLWEVFKNRANELDHLLDLSLSILASANEFPQKVEMEIALKRALTLVRT